MNLVAAHRNPPRRYQAAGLAVLEKHGAEKAPRRQARQTPTTRANAPSSGRVVCAVGR